MWHVAVLSILFQQHASSWKNRVLITSDGNFSVFFFVNFKPIWELESIFSLKTLKNNKDSVYSQTSVIYFSSYSCLVFNTMNMDQNWLTILKESKYLWLRLFFCVVMQILKNQIFRTGPTTSYCVNCKSSNVW